jgi:hypothetical protein
MAYASILETCAERNLMLATFGGQSGLVTCRLERRYHHSSLALVKDLILIGVPFSMALYLRNPVLSPIGLANRQALRG